MHLNKSTWPRLSTKEFLNQSKARGQTGLLIKNKENRLKRILCPSICTHKNILIRLNYESRQ